MAPDSRNVIVIGGGIIGLSTSYYTLTSPHLPPNSTVTLIERASIAHGASSRAAGIIASAWHSSEVIPIAEISWDCYEELNEKYDGGREWDWRTTRISGVDVGHKTVARSAYRRLPREKGRVDGESWLNGDKYDMTGEGGTATMHPGMFCAFLHARCTELGLITHIATPTSLDQGTRTVHITSAKGELAVPYDRLIFSVGPWSAPTARSLGLPVPPVSNLPGHSILIRPARDGGFDPCAETETVFAGLSGRRTGTEAADAEPSTGGVERNGGYTRSVEFVTRPSGVVYLAGENSIPHKRDSIHEESKTANHLPANPAQVIGLVDNVLVSRLVTAAAMTSPLLDLKRGAKLEKAQLCYRPTTMDGNPLIGRSGGEGMFLAAGHGPWGITLGPGTGKVTADLILDVEPSIDLSPFSPTRFGKLHAAS